MLSLIQRTAAVDDAVFRVPLVVAASPGQFVGDGGEEEEERVRDEHVVVSVDEQQHCQDCVADSWRVEHKKIRCMS